MSRGFVGDTRPRITCGSCDRSIAVTFNKHSGEMYARSHVIRPGEKCPGSGRAYPSGWPTHLRPRP